MMFKAARFLPEDHSKQLIEMARGLSMNAKWDGALRVYGVSYSSGHKLDQGQAQAAEVRNTTSLLLKAAKSVTVWATGQSWRISDYC